MMNYRHSFIVDAPLSAVAEFHKDTLALRELTPPPLTMKFNHVEPLAEGSIADFTMQAGPVSVRWVAVHSNVTEQNGFVDSQEIGPFRTWRHHHKFRAIDEQTTEVIDEIEAEYGNAISRFMWLNLPILFAYRARQTKKALEPNIGKIRGQDSEKTFNH
jgi:ligand-binding SRPBCC domain-containing protein